MPVNVRHPTEVLLQVPRGTGQVPDDTVCVADPELDTVSGAPRVPPVSWYPAPSSARLHESMVCRVSDVVGPLAAAPGPLPSSTARLQATSVTSDATTPSRRRRLPA